MIPGKREPMSKRSVFAAAAVSLFLASVLKAQEPPSLTFGVVDRLHSEKLGEGLAAENHATSLHISIYNAMKYFYPAAQAPSH